MDQRDRWITRWFGKICLVNRNIHNKPHQYPMNVISWNIWGFNKKSKQMILRKKIGHEQPIVLIMEETKCNNDKLSKVSSMVWKVSKSMEIDKNVMAGGVSIIWNMVEVVINNFIPLHHSLMENFQLIGSAIEVCLTNGYGPISLCKMFTSWNLELDGKEKRTW